MVSRLCVVLANRDAIGLRIGSRRRLLRAAAACSKAMRILHPVVGGQAPAIGSGRMIAVSPNCSTI